MQVVVLTEAEIAEVLARRGGNAAAVVETPKRRRKAKAKPEATAKPAAKAPPVPEHRALDTASMPTIPGEIEKGDIVEYVAKSNGQAKAYRVSFLKPSKYNPGNVLLLDGFLWRSEDLCRRIVANGTPAPAPTTAPAPATDADVPF
jgi:hypothetical protein